MSRFDEGYRAYKDGKQKEENPYFFMNERMKKAWEDGWESAMNLDDLLYENRLNGNVID